MVGRLLFSSGGHVWKRRGDVTILCSDGIIGRRECRDTHRSTCQNIPSRYPRCAANDQLYFDRSSMMDVALDLHLISVLCLPNYDFKIINLDQSTTYCTSTHLPSIFLLYNGLDKTDCAFFLNYYAVE